MRLKYALLSGTIVSAAFIGGAMPAHAAQIDVAESHATGRGIVLVPKSNVARPEDRGLRAHTNFEVFVPNEPFAAKANATGSPYPGYYYAETPASLACAYKLVTVVTGCDPYTVTTVPTKGSKAIAIVDAYDAPNAMADLTTFSQQFGLKVPTSSTFKVVYASGTEPSYNEDWEGEESLDIEWAHAMAPGATIYLVEAASSSNSDLYAAEVVAAKLVNAAGGGEVSNSWGGDEFSGEASSDSTFVYSKVVFFASTGDQWGLEYPSVSPNVVAVGGTSIARSTNGHLSGEYPWTEVGEGGEGVGLAVYEPRPSFQSSVSSVVGTHRGVPDIVADADPYTSPVWVYISNQGGWNLIGGTSAASPIIAGITNASGIFHSNTASEEALIYASNGTKLSASTHGYCGFYDEYVSNSTYSLCMGEGSPRGYGGE